MPHKILSSKKGFSLVETLIYIGLMSVLLGSLFYLINSASVTYLSLKSSRDIERSAINIMESIDTQANLSSKIDITNTSFDNATGSISLLSFDSLGNSTSTKIYLFNNQVMLSQNKVVLGPLGLSDVRVTSLIVRNLSTSTTDAFKVELTLDNATSSNTYLLEKFYNTYILR